MPLRMKTPGSFWDFLGGEGNWNIKPEAHLVFGCLNLCCATGVMTNCV